MSIHEEVLQALSQGPIPSAELQRRFGISQPTASRLLGRVGERVVRIGRGSRTRYGLARPILGDLPFVPLYSVDERGIVQEIAVLRGLVGGGFLVEADDQAPWLQGNTGDGLFTGLPYFLEDLRPAGFLGRQIARRLARDGSFPPDPRRWTEAQVGRYLLGHGDDLPGNLVVGEGAAQRVSAAEPETFENRGAEYPRLAVRSLEGDPPGSSAAGEQPKFVIHQWQAGPVIVKFSPAGDSAEAQRWRDLLRAEHHALAVLRDNGIPVAETAVFAFEGRVFLESRRFDRVGRLGRRPAVSLSMVDAEFGGEGQGWSRVGTALHRQKQLDTLFLEHLVWAESFGAWIGNTDMHLGNVSLAPTARGFELLPLYDMLPMAYAPVRGELPQPRRRPPVKTALNRTVWRATGEAAADFRQRVAADGEVSGDFRRLVEGESGQPMDPYTGS